MPLVIYQLLGRWVETGGSVNLSDCMRWLEYTLPLHDKQQTMSSAHANDRISSVAYGTEFQSAQAYIHLTNAVCNLGVT